MSDSLGERVRTARKRLGLGQAELGRRAGISRSYLCLLESSGRESCNAAKLLHLAQALEVSPQYLLGETPDMEPTEASKEQAIRELLEENRRLRLRLEAIARLTVTDAVA